MATIYLGLGSNLGNRRQNLERALELIASGVRVIDRSGVYEATSLYDATQPPFLNMVVRGETQLSPIALLDLIQQTERRLGRNRGHNQPRPIDIDILFYDDRVIESKRLMLPHPRLSERAFVLVPLAEIAPGLVHPVSGKTAGQMLAELPPGQCINRMEEKADV